MRLLIPYSCLIPNAIAVFCQTTLINIHFARSEKKESKKSEGNTKERNKINIC